MRSLLLGALVCCALGAGVITLQQRGFSLSDIAFGTAATSTERTPAILFTGDVFLGRAVERWQNQTPDETPFSYLHPLLQQYQSVVINFESALPAKHVPTPYYTFIFSVPTSTLAMLADHSITHAGLANNHSFDYGQAGYQHATTTMAAAGIMPIGNPLNVNQVESVRYIPYGDSAVSVIAINTIGVSVPVEDIVALIRAQTTAYTIVYIHWGEEYQRAASTAQIALATAMAGAGADIIIGHHPHVVQPISRIDDTLVFYSLGNTVFDQYFDTYVQDGLLLGLGKQDDRQGVVLYPISSQVTRHQPQLRTAADREQALTNLAAMSDLSLQTAIRQGFIPLQ